MYDTIFCDITSNCNLRCPFCSNDWSKVSGNTNIAKETFLEVVKLIPQANNFLISCSFEPTLHHEFIELLEMIPEAGKANAFFTTNLTMPLSDDFFERLAKVNIKFFNISIDSIVPETYELLRIGASFSQFKANLDKLIEVFKKYPDAPKIRIISMALRQNKDELPELSKKCLEIASEHEIRTPFAFTLNHMTEDFKGSILTDEECQALKNKLPEKALFYDIVHSNYDYNPNVLVINSNGNRQ